MAKFCEECGKKLSFRNSFIYQKRNVCRDCLKKLESGGSEQTLTDQKQPTELISLKKVYASFSLRFGILIIDWLIPAVLWVLAGAVHPLGGALLGFCFHFYNRIYLLGSRGYTIGSKLNSVVFLNKELKPIGIANAFVRELCKPFVSALFLYLGYLWMIWDKDRETWHDKIVGSRVYYTEAVQQLSELEAEYQNEEAAGRATTLAEGSKDEDKEFECPNCGKNIGREQKHCPSCGIQIDWNEFTCPNCATDIQKGQVYCPNCGTQIDWSA